MTERFVPRNREQSYQSIGSAITLQVEGEKKFWTELVFTISHYTWSEDQIWFI